MKRLLIAIFLTMATPHIMYGEQTDLTGVQIVRVPQLREWRNQGRMFTLIDARNDANFKQETEIQGASRVPFDIEERLLIERLPLSKEGTIVIYCCDEKCGASSLLAARLVKLGYKQVYVLPEGSAGWYK